MYIDTYTCALQYNNNTRSRYLLLEKHSANMNIYSVVYMYLAICIGTYEFCVGVKLFSSL